MRSLLFFVICLLALSACKQDTTTEETETDMSVKDPHSYAQPDIAKVKHLDLDIQVDFEEKVIAGVASMELEKAEGAKEVILDTKELEIEKVEVSTNGDDRAEAQYELGEGNKILGQPLKIALNDDTEFVHVTYKSHPTAEALQWLTPQQTTGKEHPFLLSQSQAINARTWIPIQDGPGIRFTYSATVKVPAELMALMSASNPKEKSEDGVYEFEMKQPIPAYLLAIAVGDVEFAEISPRAAVYAEPVMLEKSKYELGEMEEMIALAEGLYGPYRWDRYDVIVLPTSFPFGGMENPRLTFATPTIIVGDRSLTSLIAHELAHSWSGNLVTNATWDDFWLNEGFTVYFEYRIMEALKGREYSEMLAQLSYQDLQEEVADLGAENKDTHLKLELAGRNPDDGVTSIAYDKGYYFLRLLEETVGREKFDAFLRNYFDTHAFQVMDTETFLNLLKKDLLENDDDLIAKIGIDNWVYGPGIPENISVAESDKFEKVEAELKAWKEGTAAKELTAEGWSTHEWLYFIRNLPTELSQDQLSDLDAAFSLTASKNPEIQCEWYQVTLRNDYDAANDEIEAFLIGVGRRKFLRPLYRVMAESEKGLAMAKEIYAKARPNYHPVSYNTIDEILNWE